MIMSLFRPKKQNPNEIIVSKLYAHIIEAGRQPVLYAEWGVPDTPIGRYEAIGLHMILFLFRTRSTSPALEELSQDVLDEFFLELDHSVRELGVGDAGVPKRMKKLGKMFYGRMGPYWKALDDNNIDALKDALVRNITPDSKEQLASEALAQYMITSAAHLAKIDEDQLLRGEINFPQP
ncbi:ubiquinol-cytochrome C chaperone family protein [Ahrensia sp. 13_GOM-1096m]|uniref:ubiquinol-cytochrome C chaperone family protein n=1 Tax=Ahrensia sp. 13_GOM-1096m TaxID=1380380 RepID=UPI00047DD83B|nr:ubiquinol-cytochrome C chaperone family protein [Ahrensia sp. 13_GOM-1096m]